MAMKNKKVSTTEQVIYANCYGKAPSAPDAVLDTTKYQDYDSFIPSHKEVIDLSNEIPKVDVMPDSKNYPCHLEKVLYCKPISKEASVQKQPSCSEYHKKLLLKMKRTRKRKTVLAGVVGGTAGLIVFGPVAGVALGACCAIITKKNLKRKEFIQL
jgi:hypothetical protein